MGFQIENGVLTKYMEEQGVTEVVVPEAVAKIGDGAFLCCTSLTSIMLPDSVTAIGSEAFRGCSSLKSITIPNSVTEISWAAFKGCKLLASIMLTNNVTEISNSAFSGCYSLTKITIPDSVTKISFCAFFGCSSLASITLPNKVTEIGDYAFQDCKKLKSITLPDSVMAIGVEAFRGCSSLASITLPDSVMAIGVEAFRGCSSLASITIPNSVTRIEGKAFKDCKSLTNITIPNSVTMIGDKAFSRTPWFDNYPSDLVIVGDSILIKYKGSDRAVTIPTSVTTIGITAFEECTSLVSITIPNSVTEIGMSAFSGCSSLASITLPKNVTKIGAYAFYGCTSLTSITLPNSVTEIGYGAFSEYKTIQYVYASIDSPMISYLESCNPLVIDKQGEKYRFYALSFKTDDNNYMDFIKKERWNNYDMELINNGPKYKYRLPARLFGGLDRLLHPVDLTDENRQFYVELLKKNVKKVITVAEEINCPFAVKVLFDLNIIDDGNAKTVKKLLAASAIPEIAALAELCGSEVDKPKTKKKSAPKNEEPQAQADPLTAEYRDKLTSIKGDDIIKKMKLIGTIFPSVKLVDGADAPDELFRFIVASYGADNYYCINEEADKAAALLSYDSLCDAIGAISNGLDLYLYPSITPVVCRFGNPNQIKAVIEYYDTLSGAKGKSIQGKIESALAMSDTRIAVLWLEKKGDLSGFARAHNISEEQVYDKYLYDFGFDVQGKRVFDLRTTTIEATISPELTLSLVNTVTGKAVRSIPKKNVAPDVQKKAADELDDMKATMKKAAKLKKDQLFQDYLDSTETPGDEWNARYTKNPFLSAIARILVWSQDGKTFTLSDNKVIDSQGREYDITASPIKLAHTMEMDKEDIEAWQKYFTDNKLKQPFIQIWEPVIDRAFVSESRYKDCPIRTYYLKNQEKRGISIEWYSGYYSKSHYLSIEGFSVEYENVTVDGHDMVNITSIKPEKWDRRANMMISFLDRITFYGRILKDDPSIGTLLHSFTLPQIMSFIDLATKNNCTNTTAVLLNYRNDYYPEYDGYAALDDLLLDDDF